LSQDIDRTLLLFDPKAPKLSIFFICNWALSFDIFKVHFIYLAARIISDWHRKKSNMHLEELNLILFDFLDEKLLYPGDTNIKPTLFLLYSHFEYLGSFSYLRYLCRLVALGIADSTSLDTRV
jgi:hypothetical protein